MAERVRGPYHDRYPPTLPGGKNRFPNRHVCAFAGTFQPPALDREMVSQTPAILRMRPVGYDELIRKLRGKCLVRSRSYIYVSAVLGTVSSRRCVLRTNRPGDPSIGAPDARLGAPAPHCLGASVVNPDAVNPNTKVPSADVAEVRSAASIAGRQNDGLVAHDKCEPNGGQETLQCRRKRLVNG